MPRRKTHRVLGGVSGAVGAAYTARNESGIGMILESLGGFCGGIMSSVIPDVIEPAISSWHRSHAHSVAAGTTIAVSGRSIVGEWQEFCRQKAAYHENIFKTSNDFLTKLWHGFLIVVWRFLSGLAIGLILGYLSHLGADLTTRRRIPII